MSAACLRLAPAGAKPLGCCRVRCWAGHDRTIAERGPRPTDGGLSGLLRNDSSRDDTTGPQTPFAAPY